MYLLNTIEIDGRVRFLFFVSYHLGASSSLVMRTAKMHEAEPALSYALVLMSKAATRETAV